MKKRAIVSDFIPWILIALLILFLLLLFSSAMGGKLDSLGERIKDFFGGR